MLRLVALFIGIVVVGALCVLGPLWFVEHKNKKIRAARESK